MTYAKRKAATPAMAATAKEPERLDAPLAVIGLGDAVADGEVTLWGTVIPALADGAGLTVVGATVTVE